MGSLTVRDIPDQHLAGLAKAARLKKRSLSAEVRDLIAENDRRRQVEELLASIRERSKRNSIRLGPNEDAVALIRAVRDEE